MAHKIQKTEYNDLLREIKERVRASQYEADLQKEFPGVQGFSSRNIWYMRIFFLCYSANEKLQPLVAEISWAKNTEAHDSGICFAAN